ncbi:hypothetical protein DTO271G3_6785 [Paecilomyces variotii]|nr:hypothetical protein DTO271G3_6785 [Paecilomyces variotii]
MQHLRIDFILEQSLLGWINAPADFQIASAKDNMVIAPDIVKDNMLIEKPCVQQAPSPENEDLQFYCAKFDFGSYSMTIITPCAEHKSRSIKAVIHLAATKRVQWKEMVKVAKLDSTQGHQADCVVFDWVVSRADTLSDLGFTPDNNMSGQSLTGWLICHIAFGQESFF